MPIENEADKALHKEADAHKRNLKEGADVTVPTGDETSPPPRVDPFAARKAMFGKADTIRDAQAAKGGTVQDAQLEALAKEAGIDLDALRAGHTGTAPAAAPVAPENVNKSTTPEPASTTPSQTTDAYVTVTVNGAEIKVAQRDIDRAGGAEQYVARREMDAQRDALARQQADLQRQIDEMRRLQQQLQQGQTAPAGQGTDPANRAADPAAQDRNDPGNTGGVDDERLIERMADQIYSGDRADAIKGVRELVRIARGRRELPDEARIVEIVNNALAAKAEGNTQPTTPQQQQRVVDPMVERVNREINAMALAEFPDLMQLPAARAATYERFLELVQRPENANRLALDVARDALEEMEPKFINRRQAVVDRKRGLQPTSAASGVQTGADEVVPPNNASYVELLAEKRHFGRRLQR